MAGGGGEGAGKLGVEAGFASGEAFDFTTAEEQEKRNGDVGHEHDAEEPSDSITGLALVAHEAGDGEEGEHDAAHGCEMRPEAGGDNGFGHSFGHGREKGHGVNRVSGGAPSARWRDAARGGRAGERRGAGDVTSLLSSPCAA